MKFKVYNNGDLIGETVAATAAQACSMVRFRVYGLRPHDRMDLVALPVRQTVTVDISDLETSPSAIRNYPGIRVRRRGWLGRRS